VKATFFPLILFELVVVPVEWGLLVCVIGYPKGLLFLLFAANAASFLAGLLVFDR